MPREAAGPCIKLRLTKHQGLLSPLLTAAISAAYYGVRAAMLYDVLAISMKPIVFGTAPDSPQ